jgi:DNA-binding MarR family transcriptional regulator
LTYSVNINNIYIDENLIILNIYRVNELYLIGGYEMKGREEAYLSRIQELTHSIFKKVGAEISEQLSTLGLTNPQFYMLDFIRNKGQCRVTDMAKIMEVKPSAITLMIDRLESQGWVTRSQDPSDRRGVIVELTEQGKYILEEAKQLRDQLTRKYLSHLNQEELESLVKLYEKLERIISGKEKKNT